MFISLDKLFSLNYRSRRREASKREFFSFLGELSGCKFTRWAFRARQDRSISQPPSLPHPRCLITQKLALMTPRAFPTAPLQTASDCTAGPRLPQQLSTTSDTFQHFCITTLLLITCADKSRFSLINSPRDGFFTTRIAPAGRPEGRALNLKPTRRVGPFGSLMMPTLPAPIDWKILFRCPPA